MHAESVGDVDKETTIGSTGSNRALHTPHLLDSEKCKSFNRTAGFIIHETRAVEKTARGMN